MSAAIYTDNNCSDKVNGFSVASVEMVDSARVIGAPVETGAISFDNKVIDPFTVIVTGHVLCGDPDPKKRQDGLQAERKIDEMFLNRDFKFYSVSDLDDEYTDLILRRVRSKQDSQHPDWREYELQYVQAMMVQKSYSTSNPKPQNAENTSTRQIGTAAQRV